MFLRKQGGGEIVPKDTDDIPLRDVIRKKEERDVISPKETDVIPLRDDIRNIA